MNVRKIGNFYVDLDSGRIFNTNMLNNSMEPFDLQSIGGMQYNVQNGRGDVITIKIIKAELLFQIVKAHTLMLEDPHCAVTNLIELFTGFVATPFDVSWFTTTNPENVEQRAVMQAAKEGNRIVIIEMIPLIDPVSGGITLDK